MSVRPSCASAQKSNGVVFAKLSAKEKSIEIAKRRKRLLQPKSPYSALNPRPLPSVEQILAAFDYDAEISVFFYKPHPRSRAKRLAAGLVAHGYIRVPMLGHSWPAHRLIWKLHTGSDPIGLIDHINGVRYDNRIGNLRDVSAQVNNLNRHGDLNRRLAIQNKVIDRARRLAERENRERDMLAALQGKYGCLCKAAGNLAGG